MTKPLKHLDEFKKILADYEISKSSKAILRDVKLVVMVGPTSAGRNTIIQALLDTGEYHFIVSDTTRAPRKNNGVMEENGREYWFRTEEEVLADLKSGRFLEAALIHNQQVSGISLRELKKARDMQKVAVNEIEIVGAQNIMRAKPDAFALFVVPPSFEVWMQRLDGRGKLPAEEKRRRLESAVVEFSDALQQSYYKFIVNDDFRKSVERIHNLVFMGEYSPEQEQLGRDVTEKLLIETQAYLSKHA